MLEIFKEPGILEYELDIMVIAQDGKEEKGRGSGVVREVLMSFWNECFSSLTVGALEKVPNVRHDYQKGSGKQLLVSLSLVIQKLSISLSPCLLPLLLLCFLGRRV